MNVCDKKFKEKINKKLKWINIIIKIKIKISLRKAKFCEKIESIIKYF
jgi:hypothetical protein